MLIFDIITLHPSGCAGLFLSFISALCLDRLPFCHSSLFPLDPAPLWPLVTTCSIAWSVCAPVTYINPMPSPSKLQSSLLGYFTGYTRLSLVIPMCLVVTFPHLLSALTWLNHQQSLDSWLHHFPCTWGKFSTIFLLISCLPPGSQVATQDVVEAYHMIPLHPLQWPAVVVCMSDSLFCTDTCVTFGASPSCGTYGQVADAGAEILRVRGTGPVDKWVDDHIFFYIPL